MSLRKSDGDDLMPFVDRGAPILGAGRRRRMCASTSMIGIFLDDPAQGLMKQSKSKHTAGTCFMLLLYEYKPPRVAQGPCITGHRDKKKKGGERQRVHVSPCPVHSDPWEREREAAARYFGPLGSGMPIQCFLFSLFSLYARYSTGIYTRALTCYSCFVRC
ncbi:hypothetical protein CI102_12315 [Trichoderma harzianum]|nr:hypothetical protein CI102_12315 [Trichoderma harzianum]